MAMLDIPSIKASIGARQMTFYEKEIRRIDSIIYANQAQIDTVIATRRYMDQHYDAELNLDQISSAHFVSKYHLLRLFKKYYGLTPRQYLMNRRIERAKQYLRNGLTVTEACFAVGFQSLGSFSTLFRNRAGLSPQEYRKRAAFEKQPKS